MLIAAMILAALLIFGLGVFVGACWTAPEGHEDAGGFHLGAGKFTT